MTATNFRDLLAGWLSGDPRFATLSDNYADTDKILALPVPWVNCPSGCFKGGTYRQRNRMLVKFPCPACTGSGKATVAQLLAWGQAVAQPLTSDELTSTWNDWDLPFEAVVEYRNRILDVQP